MRTIWKIAVCCSLLPLAISKSYAHHSVAYEFDMGTQISVTGTVTRTLFRNPHVHYYFDVTVDGETTEWNAQGWSVSTLRESEWVKDTVKKGDTVTFIGIPSRRGVNKMMFHRATLANGRSVGRMTQPRDRVLGEDANVATSVAAETQMKLMGDWGFDTEERLPGAPLRLQFSESDLGFTASLDGTEVEIGDVDNGFSFILHREEAGGFAFQLLLTGQFDGDGIVGTVETFGAEPGPGTATSWTAKRMDSSQWAANERQLSAAVDLSGLWRRTVGVGPIGRNEPQLNAAGDARHEAFESGFYDPNLRCVATGPMRTYMDPYPIEIIQNENRITIIYEQSIFGIRRVYLDRDQHRVDFDPSPNGDAIGYWDGDTLVFETTNMSATVLTHNAEPISTDAKVIERWTLEDDGALTMEATLIDEKYYSQPVVRRTQWVNDDQIELLGQVCDPEAFYEALSFEMDLKEFFANKPEQE